MVLFNAECFRSGQTDIRLFSWCSGSAPHSVKSFNGKIYVLAFGTVWKVRTDLFQAPVLRPQTVWWSNQKTSSRLYSNGREAQMGRGGVFLHLALWNSKVPDCVWSSFFSLYCIWFLKLFNGFNLLVMQIEVEDKHNDQKARRSHGVISEHFMVIQWPVNHSPMEYSQ